MCCRVFKVPILPHEALWLIRRYGNGVAYFSPEKRKYYLAKKPNGSCVFLDESVYPVRCTIHFEKPFTCRLWPFHITRKPISNLEKEYAEFQYRDETYYVYLNSSCQGIGYGYPLPAVIPRYIELWLKKEKLLHRV